MAMNQKLTVQEIAAQIHQACIGLEPTWNTQDQADRDLKAARVGTANARLSICRAVAKLAHDGDWDDAYLDDAVKLAQATPHSNQAETQAAIAVFCSQVKACARPRVRGQFATIADAIANAWAVEKQAMDTARAKKETADTPLRKFVSREYEMVLRACREIHEGKTNLRITCADDVVNWARNNDPDQNAEQIAKRIKRLAITLHEFYQEFPHQAINDAKQLIGSIAAVELQAVRDAKRKAEADKLASVPLAPIPPVIQAQVAQALAQNASEAPQGAEPAEGVYDTFDVDVTLNDAPLVNHVANDRGHEDARLLAIAA